MANEAVLSAGGVGSWISAHLTLAKPTTRKCERERPLSALSSLAFVLFALLFGVVSQRAGVFHAGWMVFGVALLAGALLVTIAMSRDAQRQLTAV